MTVLIFGVGPLGLAIARQFKDRGHAIIATGRSASKRHFLNQLGYRSLDPIDIKDNPNLFSKAHSIKNKTDMGFFK
jgi:predicted dinucleotide-binding enzyme